MSEKSLVRVHSPNGAVVEVFTAIYHHEILEFLPRLFEKEISLPIQGTPFFIQSSVSSRTHVFIARENPSRIGGLVVCVIDVFAVPGDEAGRGLTSDEVFNRAVSTFEGEFSAEDKGSLTAYMYNENVTDVSNGFPCGCIFTINSFDVSFSISPSPSLTPSSSSSYPDQLYTPYRPSLLMNPTPVENNSNEYPNSSTRKGQIVHEAPAVLGEGQYAGFGKSVGYTGQHLHSPGELSTDPIDTGEETGPPTDQVLHIPASTVEDHCDDGSHDDNNEVAMVSPHEESSLSASSEKSGEMEETDVITNFSFKLISMVTGCLPPTTRPASLSATVPLLRPRRRSHDPAACARRLQSDISETVEALREQFLDDDDDNYVPLVKPEESRIPFLRSISGPPTTPVRDSAPTLVQRGPTRTEREEGDGEGGKNEFVVGTKTPKVNPSREQRDLQLLPSPSNLAVEPINSGKDEVVEPECGNRDAPALIDEREEVLAVKANDIPDDGVPGGRAVSVIAAPIPTMKIEALTTSSSSSPSDNSSRREEECGEDGVSNEEEGVTSSDQEEDEQLDQISFDKVHLLEHACNGQCWLQDSCPSKSDPSFVERLEQMRNRVAKLREGGRDEDMKRYIRFHCSRFCPGNGCTVPHLAAGCPPASLPSTSTPTPTIQKCSPVVSSAKGCVDVSFDLRVAFDSTTPETDEEVLPVEPRPGDLSLHLPVPAATEDTPTGVPYRHHPPAHPPIRTPRGVLSPGQRFTQAHSPHQMEFTEGNARKHPLCVNNQSWNVTPLPRNATPFHQKATPLERKALQISGGQEGTGANKMVYQYQMYDRQEKERFTSQSERVWSLPDVHRNGFPEYDTYKSIPPGAVIYSHKDMSPLLEPGTVLSLPSDRDPIGTGGNGCVYKTFLCTREFAVKKTGYRPAELNTWKELDHPNLVPLRGVMVGKQSLKTGKIQCYQFMDRMTDHLGNMVRKTGCLSKLSKEEDPAIWLVIMDNIKYIIRSVSKALEYLEKYNIQHCDVKGSNILIRLSDTCQCQDILHCTCPEDEKYQVKLADFDSIKKSQYRRASCTLPDVECRLKPLECRKKVMGTPAYRPAEQFNTPLRHHYLLENVVNGAVSMDFEGPWCDIWSLGMVILRICLGKDTEAEKHDANILIGQPHFRDLSTSSEAIHAQIKLKGLCKVAANDPNLTLLANLADMCLTVDFRKRLSAEKLLLSNALSK